MLVTTPSSSPARGYRNSSAPAERDGICVDAGLENKYGVDMRVSEKVMGGVDDRETVSCTTMAGIALILACAIAHAAK